MGAPTLAVRVDSPVFGPEQGPVVPSPGFWTVAGRPGVGVFLQHQGNVLVATLLDFMGGPGPDLVPRWMLGAATLGAAETTLGMTWYMSGSCFHCSPVLKPAPGYTRPLRLSFDTARTGTLTLADGTGLPMQNLAFGASYAASWPPGAEDDGATPLALPDLKGTWVFPFSINRWYGIIDDRVDQQILVLDVGPEPVAGGLRWSSAASPGWRVDCSPASPQHPAQCTLALPHHDFTQYYPVARLGDIAEDRMRFTFLGVSASTDETLQGSFQAVRMPDAD